MTEYERETALVLVDQPGGVLVVGNPGAIEAVVARLVEAGGAGARAASSATAMDLAAAAATIGALVAPHGQYVRLTPRSMELLRKLKMVPTGRGSFWGFVRDSSNIRGVLDFQMADLGPPQMMALQQAAVSMALRAVIKEVQAAVERVEGKVDDVLGLLRAEHVGDILGTRRALQPLVQRVRQNGRISSTDWSAVAALGADIDRDIEALRTHIRSRLDAADGGWKPGDRVEDAEALFEKKGLLAESVALLVVAEDNLGAWHELRLAHVRLNESAHLAWTLEDGQAAIAAQNKDDQAIVDGLRAVADQLTTAQPYDGLVPWQRREFTEARSKLDELAGWFADQRVLDLKPLGALPYPTVKESFRRVTRDVSRVTRDVGGLAGRSFDAVREKLRRGDDHDTTEPPPNSPDA